MAHLVAGGPRHGRRWPWLLLAALVLVFAVFVAVVLFGGSAPTTAPAPTPVLSAATPTEVKVPAIGAQSSLVGLGLGKDNTMATPPVSKPQQASYFTGAPAPGQKGPAVILGHINGNGKPGVFVNLAKLKVGDQVEVDRADHTAAFFTVTQVETVDKGAFPAGQVFNDTADAQLRLISCGGALNVAKHSYDSNIIALATMTRVQHI